MRFFLFSFLALRLPFLGLPVSAGALEGTISRRLVASNRSLLKSVPVLPSPAGPRLGFESKSSSNRRTWSSRRSEKWVEKFWNQDLNLKYYQLTDTFFSLTFFLLWKLIFNLKHLINSHAVRVRYCLRYWYGRCAAKLVFLLCKTSNMKIGLRKWIFFWWQEFFSLNFHYKNGSKMNLLLITKNNSADPEIGFLVKSI